MKNFYYLFTADASDQRQTLGSTRSLVSLERAFQGWLGRLSPARLQVLE
jgi:hypothetical protein